MKFSISAPVLLVAASSVYAAQQAAVQTVRFDPTITNCEGDVLSFERIPANSVKLCQLAQQTLSSTNKTRGECGANGTATTCLADIFANLPNNNRNSNPYVVTEAWQTADCKGVPQLMVGYQTNVWSKPSSNFTAKCTLGGANIQYFECASPADLNSCKLLKSTAKNGECISGSMDGKSSISQRTRCIASGQADFNSSGDRASISLLLGVVFISFLI